MLSPHPRKPAIAHALVITMAPLNRFPCYCTYLGRLLVAGLRMPLLAAAHELIRLGADPDALIVIRHTCTSHDAVRKLKAYGLKKVIPDDDLLAKTYRAFHHSQQLRTKFEQIKDEFEETGIKVPRNLKRKFARSLMNTAICAGTMRSTSCSMERS